MIKMSRRGGRLTDFLAGFMRESDQATIDQLDIFLNRPKIEKIGLSTLISWSQGGPGKRMPHSHYAVYGQILHVKKMKKKKGDRNFKVTDPRFGNADVNQKEDGKGRFVFIRCLILKFCVILEDTIC